MTLASGREADVSDGRAGVQHPEDLTVAVQDGSGSPLHEVHLQHWILHPDQRLSRGDHYGHQAAYLVTTRRYVH